MWSVLWKHHPQNQSIQSHLTSKNKIEIPTSPVLMQTLACGTRNENETSTRQKQNNRGQIAAVYLIQFAMIVYLFIFFFVKAI